MFQFTLVDADGIQLPRLQVGDLLRGRSMLKGVCHGSEREEMGKDEPGHDDAAHHETDGGHQTGPLQAAEAHDGVAARATTGVACAEAHHESAEHEEDQAT